MNYDFIKKSDNNISVNNNSNVTSNNKKNSKSSVRVLEPDLNYVIVNGGNHQNQDQLENGDEDEENYQKIIQCQQISMYIGENFLLNAF